MKIFFNLFLRLALLCAVTACVPGRAQTPTATLPPAPAGDSLRGVFEGITPCSSQTRPLSQIPPDSNCELMTWKLVLYQDASTGTPTDYALESAYGPSQPNTMYPAGGGTPISMKGQWSIGKGIKLDPDAEVYQLYTEDSPAAVSFAVISEDILHVLNQDQTLMIGNAAWSYTLNRTDNRDPLDVKPVSEPPRPTRPPIPDTPPGSSVLGVFEGRLPCHEIVFEILNITPYSGCLKLKSRLVLYQNQETGAPSTYMYMGTNTIRQGTWTILQGTEDKPEAVVYQLQLEGSQEPVSFLKVDENHLLLLDRDLHLLVGNALFSYTLSRSEQETN